MPVPGPNTIAVGGNTSCISIIYRDYVIIFDAGTGIRNLGHYLEDSERSKWSGSIFLTHYHWDHIQGLPFFTPAFRNDNRFHVYGERKKGNTLQEILSEQMQPPYFPASLENLEGLMTFNEIKPFSVTKIMPEVGVDVIRLSHPNGAVGYRFDCQKGSICLITDHEHPSEGLDKSVLEFVHGSSVLIHDAQYTPEEKKGPKSGWGHSSWMEAALTAREADVGMLYLFHHDPNRTDDELKAILTNAKDIFPHTEIAMETYTVAFP
jgi:phosphoribosyl 1,2-cyclic phosphodiesterase